MLCHVMCVLIYVVYGVVCIGFILYMCFWCVVLSVIVVCVLLWGKMVNVMCVSSTTYKFYRRLRHRRPCTWDFQRSQYRIRLPCFFYVWLSNWCMYCYWGGLVVCFFAFWFRFSVVANKKVKMVNWWCELGVCVRESCWLCLWCASSLSWYDWWLLNSTGGWLVGFKMSEERVVDGFLFAWLLVFVLFGGCTTLTKDTQVKKSWLGEGVTDCWKKTTCLVFEPIKTTDWRCMSLTTTTVHRCDLLLWTTSAEKNNDERRSALKFWWHLMIWHLTRIIVK